jgi:hypothetical protein
VNEAEGRKMGLLDAWTHVRAEFRIAAAVSCLLIDLVIGRLQISPAGTESRSRLP